LDIKGRKLAFWRADYRTDKPILNDAVILSEARRSPRTRLALAFALALLSAIHEGNLLLTALTHPVKLAR
jgi:hypothetical protein